MARRADRWLWILLTVAFLCAWPGSAGAQGSVAGDRAVLTTLYNNTGGSDWDHGTNWLTDAPLRDWYGIETDASGRVAVVSLTRNGLTGEVPSDLGDLDRLEELWLTANDLSGEIPPELGGLANLEVLSLAVNRLAGSIPTALGNLNTLEQLNLNDNRLSGSIRTELENLSRLVDFSLSGNALSDSIPTGLGDLNGLKWLTLGRNDLTGAVPGELVSLLSLESLYLNDNRALSGSLPVGLMFLPNLGSVDIRNTGLCAPEDGPFRTWAATIDFRGCGTPAPSVSGPPGSGGGPPPPGVIGGDEDEGGEDGGGGTEPPPPPPPSGPPKADFTLTSECPADLCRARTGLAVTFEDTSTGRAESRLWDFGDGTTSRNRRIDHAWSSPGFYEVTLTVSDGTTVSTARQMFLVEANDPVGTCVSDVETLCLRDSRYAVDVEWRRADGGSGAASVVHSGTNDSGLFWFFGRDNWEILIKVLDGCALNGHMWVFGASTTDLGYVIRVTDTVTGAVKEYRNEPGRPAPAITDVKAFQACAR